MKARPYHHGNLREALLQQAERTVREQGVEALSLRELAREVGVSHAAPRRHFADRQALLDALAAAGFERLGTELQAAVEAAGRAFPDRLQALAASYVRFATTESALLELMFTGKHRDPGRSIQDAADRTFAFILELIKEGQTNGFLEQGDPERIGLVFFASLHGIAALVTVGMVTPERADQALDDAIAQFLHRR